MTVRDAGDGRTVVDRLSFDLKAGEVLGLVGESGSGKTMTAKALMGLLSRPPYSVQASRLRLGDLDLRALGEKRWRKVRGRLMSMVFQEPLTSLDPVFTVGNQLSTLMRRHRGMGRRESRIASAEVLGRVGLADTMSLLSRYPHELSGGMRQRIMLAMAMACEPDVLIADEPTSSLDLTTQAQVLSQLTGMGRSLGTAILLITHDLGVVAQYCDRALVMRDGRALEQAPVETLFTTPQQSYTRRLIADVPAIRPPAANGRIGPRDRAGQ